MGVASGCGHKEVYILPGAHKGRSVQFSTIG